MIRPRRALCAAAFVVGSSLALAQTASVEADSAELEQFAEAQEQIDEIRQEYSQKINDAKGDAETRELHEAAQDEMAEVVQSVGLDVNTYNQLAIQYESDPAFRQQVDAQ